MRIQIDINIPDHLTKAEVLEIVHDGLGKYIGNYDTGDSDLLDEKAVCEALATAVAMERNMEASDKRRLKGIGIG